MALPATMKYLEKEAGSESEKTPIMDTVTDEEIQRTRPPGGGARIHLDRPALTNDEFYDMYHIQEEPDIPIKDRIKSALNKKCKCSAEIAKTTFFKKVPSIPLLMNYKWKEWIPSDIISGISVGVIHIPQGMGFALLTSLPAVYGLYASIFPVWIYFLFGTSRHISVGTMALTSLMIGAVVNTESEAWLASRASSVPVAMVTSSPLENTTGDFLPGDDQELIQFKVEIAMSMTLLMGLFQLVMWLLNLSVLATYMSMPFISGFMTGAACHIITSQVPSLFGLKIQKFSGTFSLPRTYVEVFKNITSTNVASLVTGVICIIALLVLKEVVSPRLKKYIKVPLPAELLVVILGTLISYLAKFNERWDVRIIGTIPRGIPAPTVPTMYNASNYIADGIMVAIVGFAISVSMAKLMSKKHGYSIDVNQEIFAYGLQNTIGSFLISFGGTQAPPRTLVCDATGGKTQLSGLISTILPLLVCLALGPLFESLPNCVLAAIIIVALIPLLKSFADMPNLYRVNKIDLAVYIITVLTTVVFSIVVGLIAGIGVSIFLVVARMQFSKTHLMKDPEETSVYIKGTKVEEKPKDKIMVYKLESHLFFVNAEALRLKIMEGRIMLGVDMDNNYEENKQVATNGDVCENGAVELTVEVGERNGNIDKNADKAKTMESPRGIILDCSAISYIDMMGLNALKSAKEDCGKHNIPFALACCDENMISKLYSVEMLKEDSKEDNVKVFGVYPSIQDAVETIRYMAQKG